jgi:hypothetical protein
LDTGIVYGSTLTVPRVQEIVTAVAGDPFPAKAQVMLPAVAMTEPGVGAETVIVPVAAVVWPRAALVRRAITASDFML